MNKKQKTKKKKKEEEYRLRIRKRTENKKEDAYRRRRIRRLTRRRRITIMRKKRKRRKQMIKRRIKTGIKMIIRHKKTRKTSIGILITRRIERIGFIQLIKSTYMLHFVFKIIKRSTFTYQKPFTHIFRLESGSVKEAPLCDPYRQLYFLHLAVLSAEKQSSDKKKKAKNMFNNLYSVNIQKIANKKKKIEKIFSGLRKNSPNSHNK